jgi:hypothetical protein
LRITPDFHREENYVNITTAQIFSTPTARENVYKVESVDGVSISDENRKLSEENARGIKESYGASFISYKNSVINNATSVEFNGTSVGTRDFSGVRDYRDGGFSRTLLYLIGNKGLAG